MDVCDDEKIEDIDAKSGEKASKSLFPGETSKRKTGSKYVPDLLNWHILALLACL